MDNNNKPNQKTPNNKKNNKLGIPFIAFVTLATLIFVLSMSGIAGKNSSQEITYNKFLQMIEKDEDSVILCFPCVFDHHTEYGKYIDEIKLEKPCYTLEEIKLMIAEGKSVKGKTICAINEINFDFEKSTIKDESKPYLDQLAHVLKEIDMDVEVKGHTDDKGSDEFNMRLSKDRALAVVNYLMEKGVSKDRISYSYYGERLPITANSTPEGRQQNRRVEFELIK